MNIFSTRFSSLNCVGSTVAVVALSVVSANFSFAQNTNTSQQSSATDVDTNWRVERQALDLEFADHLQQIGVWCRDNGVEQQVAETFKLYQPRDLSRQYIFLPPESSMPSAETGLVGQWLSKVHETRTWQAERIFELSKKAAKAGAGNAAFQLLNEVLYFDKDHAAVRKILGHRRTDDGWRVASDKIKVRPGSRNHDTLKWPAKSYLLVTTPNFEIESNASEEQTRYLAQKLERWHAVWRQVFFEYWSSAAALDRWIDGKSSYRHSRKKFRVVFFKNKTDYLSELSRFVPGIEMSTGYYFQRISYFYDDPDRSVEDTWRHELTHQLFRESIKTGKAPFDDHFIWLDEGIATYFESLSDFGDYVTLGGFESSRIQYARIRTLLEKLPVSLAELSQLGREDLQQRDDIARLYSVAAGFTDMLMNDDRGALEPKLTEFLKIIFAGRKIKDNTFETIIGRSYAELDEQYKEFLLVDPTLIAKHLRLPLSRTVMSLPGSKIDLAGFEALGQCHNLIWIDLSNNTITADGIAKLAGCQDVHQLFLTECQLARGALAQLAIFENLEELDLSGSSIVDPQLRELAGLKGLESLRLKATRISDKGLAVLAGMPNLKSLDLTRSRVSNAGFAKLKQRRPDLNITK